MSNPTFRSGPISFEVAADTEKFRLVAVDEAGKIKHADASGDVFGAVTEAGRLEPKDPGAATIAVHYGPAAVKLETDGAIKAGAAVFAAADGKASASGSVQVGVAVRDTENGKTLTILNHLPAVAAAAAES